VPFKRGNTACIRATFTGAQAESTERIAVALDQWAALGPGGAASVERANDTATLTTCDPGTAPDEAKITSSGDVLDTRASILFARSQRARHRRSRRVSPTVWPSIPS
jgi:hypothetical protein